MGWSDTYESLSGAESAEDFELLATAAFMLGRDEEHHAALERAHRAWLDRSETRRAALCAFWIGMHLIVRGEVARGTGWLGRSERTLEGEPEDCVERAYLLMPGIFKHVAEGDLDAAIATAGQAAAAGERFGDRDLFALSVQDQGYLLIRSGRSSEGLGLLDEAMVAVTAGELSPIVSGLVYCGVILGCREAWEPGRAQEWTAALTRWCERQPDMVAFTGRCLVHRAELMHMHGAWRDAIEEARAAVRRCRAGNNERAAGDGLYLEGEVHRVRGDLGAADDAYREASRCGREPQPGMALLRLAQGDAVAAAASIRRALAENDEPSTRARLLPAQVEIALAAGEAVEARAACEELERMAAAQELAMLATVAVEARGKVELAAGDAEGALAPLRRAADGWRELDAPYEAARARLLVADACAALGDAEGAALEREAAQGVLDQLGAGGGGDAHGLTPRELQVLRLVAAGDTNKAIAAELVLSERTVDRHVSNIFGKLRVSSRAAATAYAYEHRLV